MCLSPSLRRAFLYCLSQLKSVRVGPCVVVFRILGSRSIAIPFFQFSYCAWRPSGRAKGRLKNHFGVLAIAAHQALNTEDVPLYSPASRRVARARWVGNSINRKRTPNRGSTRHARPR